MSELEAMMKTLRFAGYDVARHADQQRMCAELDALRQLLAKYVCDCRASEVPIGAPPLRPQYHFADCRYVAAMRELEQKLARELSEVQP